MLGIVQWFSSSPDLFLIITVFLCFVLFVVFFFGKKIFQEIIQGIKQYSLELRNNHVNALRS